MTAPANSSRTYVALLRGINVGGRKRVAMADLQKLFQEAGCSSVTTYMQSGNIVFTSAAPASKLTADLEERISKALGLEISVVIRTQAELASLVQRNPFAARGADPAELHVVFLKERPPADALARIDPADFAPEQFASRGSDIYLRLPNGMGRARLNQSLFERVLKTPATARNWKTATNLLALAEETARQPGAAATAESEQGAQLL